MPIGESFARRLEPMLADLVACYATPFHIYDLAGICETHRAMSRVFAGRDFRQYFAVKALPNPAVLSALLGEGSGLDCSSPAELELARRAGAAGEDIVFTSTNTEPSEYEAALDAGALITFDDLRILERAATLPPIVAFRVAPHGAAAGSHLMGAADRSKFGVPRAQLVAAYESARRRGVTRFGIHGMTCANELDAGRAARAAEDLIEAALAVCRATGIVFEYVNFGGGLGIPYRPEERAIDLGAYAQAIAQSLERAFGRPTPRILMECGRYVSGPHGVLVCRVVTRCRKGREIAGVDASMSALLRPALYGAYHHVTLPLAGRRQLTSVDVVGSLCENTDRLAVDRLLPDPREGDILLVHDTGAHGHAMGFTYNGRLRPAELLLTANDDVLEIRRAETFDDYVATVRWQPPLIRRAASPSTSPARPSKELPA